MGFYCAVTTNSTSSNSRKALGAQDVHLATESEVKQATGAPVGFAGPVGLDAVVSIVADHGVAGMQGAVTGANEADALLNVNAKEDFSAQAYADLRLAGEGDPCPRCSGTLTEYRGIEVGHVFFLGTKCPRSMRCHYLDESGKSGRWSWAVMALVSPGSWLRPSGRITTTMALFSPSLWRPSGNYSTPPDEQGAVVEAADQLYSAFQAAGYEVVLDDRNERAGSKFKDSELMGAPIRIAIGSRGLESGMVEVKRRSVGPVEEVPLDAVVTWVQENLK